MICLDAFTWSKWQVAQSTLCQKKKKKRSEELHLLQNGMERAQLEKSIPVIYSVWQSLCAAFGWSTVNFLHSTRTVAMIWMCAVSRVDSTGMCWLWELSVCKTRQKVYSFCFSYQTVFVSTEEFFLFLLFHICPHCTGGGVSEQLCSNYLLAVLLGIQNGAWRAWDSDRFHWNVPFGTATGFGLVCSAAGSPHRKMCPILDSCSWRSG